MCFTTKLLSLDNLRLGYIFISIDKCIIYKIFLHKECELKYNDMNLHEKISNPTLHED